MRKVPYTPREPSKVEREVWREMESIFKYAPLTDLQSFCDSIREKVKDAWGYDPQLSLKVYSHLGEVRMVRTHWLKKGTIKEGDSLTKTFVKSEECASPTLANLKEVIEDYVKQVVEVLSSVTVFTERGFEDVVHGDQLIVKNGYMYVSNDLSFMVEGSDSYGVLETDERWVKLEGLGYVGWDKVISLI